MRISISIDMLASYLSNFIWEYLEEHGVPAQSPKAYHPNVDNLFGWAERDGDVPYLRAGLDALTEPRALTPELMEVLEDRCNFAFGQTELVRILRYMREQIDLRLDPSKRDDVQVEFVRTGLDEAAWRTLHVDANPALDRP